MKKRNLSKLLGYGLVVIGIVFLISPKLVGALLIGLGIGYLAYPFIQKTFFKK